MEEHLVGYPSHYFSQSPTHSDSLDLNSRELPDNPRTRTAFQPSNRKDLHSQIQRENSCFPSSHSILPSDTHQTRFTESTGTILSIPVETNDRRLGIQRLNGENLSPVHPATDSSADALIKWHYTEILRLNDSLEQGKREKPLADLWVRTKRGPTPWNNFFADRHSQLDSIDQTFGRNTAIIANEWKLLTPDQKLKWTTPRKLGTEERTARKQYKKALHELQSIVRILRY